MATKVETSLRRQLKWANEELKSLRNERDRIRTDRNRYREFIQEEYRLQNECKSAEYYAPKTVNARISRLAALVDNWIWQ